MASNTGNVKYDLFVDLIAALRLNTDFKYCSSWNQNEKKLLSMNQKDYPQVYIQIVVTWEESSKDTQNSLAPQTGEATITAHILNKCLDKDETHYKNDLVLMSSASRTIVNCKGVYYGNIIRKSDMPDDDFDQLSHSIITFECEVNDVSLGDNYTKQTGVTADFVIEIVDYLQVDNGEYMQDNEDGEPFEYVN